MWTEQGRGGKRRVSELVENAQEDSNETEEEEEPEHEVEEPAIRLRM